jgi:hypothetical protein
MLKRKVKFPSYILESLNGGEGRNYVINLKVLLFFTRYMFRARERLGLMKNKMLDLRRVKRVEE